MGGKPLGKCLPQSGGTAGSARRRARAESPGTGRGPQPKCKFWPSLMHRTGKRQSRTDPIHTRE
eukprot:7914303-Heterocapsa_arctica.AAC.1